MNDLNLENTQQTPQSQKSRGGGGNVFNYAFAAMVAAYNVYSAQAAELIGEIEYRNDLISRYREEKAAALAYKNSLLEGGVPGTDGGSNGATPPVNNDGTDAAWPLTSKPADSEMSQYDTWYYYREDNEIKRTMKVRVGEDATEHDLWVTQTHEIDGIWGDISIDSSYYGEMSFSDYQYYFSDLDGYGFRFDFNDRTDSPVDVSFALVFDDDGNIIHLHYSDNEYMDASGNNFSFTKVIDEPLGAGAGGSGLVVPGGGRRSPPTPAGLSVTPDAPIERSAGDDYPYDEMSSGTWYYFEEDDAEYRLMVVRFVDDTGREQELVIRQNELVDGSYGEPLVYDLESGQTVEVLGTANGTTSGPDGTDMNNTIYSNAAEGYNIEIIWDPDTGDVAAVLAHHDEHYRIVPYGDRGAVPPLPGVGLSPDNPIIGGPPDSADMVPNTWYYYRETESSPLKRVMKTPTTSEDQQLQQQIMDYYNTEGMWAGLYTMHSIESMWIEQTGEDQYVVHVRYRHVPLNEGQVLPAGYVLPTGEVVPVDTPLYDGYDQRTFTVKVSGDQEEVVAMGDHMSASMDDNDRGYTFTEQTYDEATNTWSGEDPSSSDFSGNVYDFEGMTEAEIDAHIEKLEDDIASLSSTNQMDILKLQKVIHDMNLTIGLITQMIKSDKDAREGVVRNI